MKLSPTNLYEDAQKRLTELQHLYAEKEQELKRMPAGKIHIVQSKNRVQFYLREDAGDKSGTYLKRSDSGKIKKYVQKAYSEKVIKVISKEIKNLETFLSKSQDTVSQIQQLYSSNPEMIKKCIAPVDCSSEDYVKQWCGFNYVGKEIRADTQHYHTDLGEIVRSKSELNIANALHKHGIPYRYECPLKLKNGETIYPDFTILNLSNRSTVYWEHRGMMDDRTYAKHTVQRLKDYEKSNIWLGDNLIITEETSTNALGTIEIEAIIKHYFIG